MTESDAKQDSEGLESAGEEATPVPAFHRRLLDVFFSPGRVMEALARNPVWAAALIFGVLLVLLQTFLIPVEVWQETFKAAALQRGQELPEGFGMGPFMRISAVVGGGVGWFVFAFLMAGITTVLFAFVLGDEGRYRQYLAVLAHAWLIPAFVGLALIPLRIAESNPQLTLNLGSFFFFLPDGYVLKVLTMLDLSQLWAWVVMAQGVHAIEPRRSVKSAATILLLMALALALIFAPFAPTG